ncbi:unnamed protein product [Dovyalis caffra]|uniref:Uncharacterized protein n=1 Tax=Dovyalis caffra TaxID=77055 RepID=A0AAV1RA70_9ROSI|nr:unnamed protein product [Dovyalis caffra]
MAATLSTPLSFTTKTKTTLSTHFGQEKDRLAPPFRPTSYQQEVDEYRHPTEQEYRKKIML